MGPALGTRPAQHQRPVGTARQPERLAGHWRAQHGKVRTPRCLKNIQIMLCKRSCPPGPCLVRELVWVPLVHGLRREQECVVLSHVAWRAGPQTQEQAHLGTSQHSCLGFCAQQGAERTDE